MTKKILIVEARFYADLADELTSSAIDTLKENNFEYEKISVPGVFEIPAAINFASHKNEYAGYIALGCVIRGETTHYDYVCNESARGLNQLALRKDLAIGYGIITCEDFDQAWVRASRDKKNKGRDATIACIEMIKLKERFLNGK